MLWVWLCGSMYSYYPHQAWFDPELWHLPGRQVRCMLIMPSRFLSQESQTEHAVPDEIAIV